MSILRAATFALSLSLIATGASSLSGCSKGGAASMNKGSKKTKMGKVIGELTKDDLSGALTKNGFNVSSSSTSTSPGTKTASAAGKKGDLFVFITWTEWEDPKSRAGVLSSKQKDANVAVFVDGDYWVTVEAKEKDKPNGAKSREMMSLLVGP